MLHKNFFNKIIPIYLIVGSIALGFRLFLNFHYELIPGVNGGYYPLQVRSVLTNGHLGFSDMPFLFYFDAFIIRTLSLFGYSITDTLILQVVKIVDSASLPLLLIPLYKIMRIGNQKQPITFETSIIFFTGLSFTPLILTSDLQKNALAITFLFCFIAYLLSYQYTKKKLEIYLSIVFLLLTGLTHFGTFLFALFFMALIMGYIYKKKAIIPLILVILLGLCLIAIFDTSRFNRVFSIGTVMFEKPALIKGMLALPDYLIILISIILSVIGALILKTKYTNLIPPQKATLFFCISCLILLSFPLFDGEYFKRLSLFLFIPQTLILIQIGPFINTSQLKKISISLFIVTTLSVLAALGHPKEPVINNTAFQDLNKLNAVLQKDNETIIVARHGLEWWTAWVLHTKVAQDKAIDDIFFEKYKSVVFINQINGFSKHHKGTPFHEPIVPHQAEIIFSSNFFRIFTLNLPK